MSAPENPLAFPSVENHPSFAPMHHRGMSLRDWFAGQAIAGFAGNQSWLVGVASKDANLAGTIARACFEIADAMLAERAKGGAA